MVGISAYGALDADIRGRGLSDTHVPPAVARIQLNEMGEMGVVLLVTVPGDHHVDLRGLPAATMRQDGLASAAAGAVGWAYAVSKSEGRKAHWHAIVKRHQSLVLCHQLVDQALASLASGAVTVR